MNHKTQYEKDLAYIARIDNMLSKKVEFLAYFVALVACLAAHVMYFLLFTAYGIREMAAFNVGSIIFYVMTIILTGHVKEKVNLVYAALAEIIVHATFATAYVGWKPNFTMFLLMIIPIAFLMPNKRKYIPFVIMGISALLYVLLHFFDQSFTNVRYEFGDDELATVFFMVNAAAGVFVLVYVTYIYTLTNMYQESKLRVQNEQLRIMACIDPLTKLNNRRAMGDELKRIAGESDRSGKKYVIGLGDIDNFKKVNDVYGHEYGDLVLAEVSKVISEGVGGKGVVARWGGEEFLFVIPEASLKEVVGVTEKILQEVRRHEFEKDGKSFRVTMTFGVCEGQGLEAIDASISAADALLYHGKYHGKDQVVVEAV